MTGSEEPGGVRQGGRGLALDTPSGVLGHIQHPHGAGFLEAGEAGRAGPKSYLSEVGVQPPGWGPA